MMEGGGLIPGDVLNRAILYVTAIMEMKSSLGVIVAAPTAGLCGALPGALLAVADVLGSEEQARVDAMLAAGMVGGFHRRPLDICGRSCGVYGRVWIGCGHGGRRDCRPRPAVGSSNSSAPRRWRSRTRSE